MSIRHLEIDRLKTRERSTVQIRARPSSIDKDKNISFLRNSMQYVSSLMGYLKARDAYVQTGRGVSHDRIRQDIEKYRV